MIREEYRRMQELALLRQILECSTIELTLNEKTGKRRMLVVTNKTSVEVEHHDGWSDRVNEAIDLGLGRLYSMADGWQWVGRNVEE